MYLDAFFDAAQQQLNDLRTGQRSAIEQAGLLIANAVEQQGVIAVFDTGHLLQHEAQTRAGGLAALIPFSFSLALELPVPHRPAPADDPARLQALVALALDSAALRPGDVLVLNSNSGYSARVIELALQAGARGMRTIGIASAAQMAACTAAHPSGVKLDAAAELFIDNASPFGDAAVPLPDNEPMCPLSGIGSALILWAMQAEAVRLLAARGVRPTIYRSVHAGGGEAFMHEQARHYAQEGR